MLVALDVRRFDPGRWTFPHTLSAETNLHMTQETYRSIGAIVGVIIGVVSMALLGFSGLIAGFCFGAGGAVLGGILGERVYSMRHKNR